MKEIFKILFSTRLMAFLFIVFAAAMGIATFIENDYGTPTARKLVYDTAWFEMILLFFVINFAGNIKRYSLWKIEKWPTLTLHLSFILIIVGAWTTRYISYEGVMPIKEGETSNIIYSQETYLKLQMNDGVDQKTPLYKRLRMGKIGDNDFILNTDFKDVPVQVNYVNYVANAKQEFRSHPDGEKYLHLVESGSGKRDDHYIKEGDVVNIHNILFAYNQLTEGAVNFIESDSGMLFKTVFNGQFMRMADRSQGQFHADSLSKFNFRSLYQLANLSFVVPSVPETGKFDVVSGEADANPYDMIEVQVIANGESQNVRLKGGSYSTEPAKQISLGGLNFILSYGSKAIELPFNIELLDFQLEKYPGSMSPKSYASEVKVHDAKEVFPYRIFMNNVLDHRGFRFFQAAYVVTEEYEESRLSVTHDLWGTWITYIGYALLYLGLILILFMKNTRFSHLRATLKKVKDDKEKLTTLLLVLGFAFSVQAQDHNEHDGHDHSSHEGHDHSTTNSTDNSTSSASHNWYAQYDNVDSVLNAETIDLEHAKRFGHVVVQDEGGRMKPLNTYGSELLRKVSKKDKYHGLTSDQVVLSMIKNPQAWYFMPMIYMKKANSKVRDLLGISQDTKYARLFDFFDNNGNYKLTEAVENAFKKKIKNKFEESVLNIDTRANLLYAALSGEIFRLFPLENHPNNKWFSYVDSPDAGFKGVDSLYVGNAVPLYAQSLGEALSTGNYTNATKLLESIEKYQHKYGSKVIPSDEKVKFEILYNKYDVFKSLYTKYMLLGLILFVLVIIEIFKSSKSLRTLIKVSVVSIWLLFVIQTVFLGIRWYISGHAPWSNAYESMIYVSWATMLFGLIFGKKSTLTLAATAFVTSMILMIAHWNWMDPSINNLVPVLDSYWLMIHVAIIVASYGPFTLCMILGFVSLFVMMFTNEKNKKKLDLVITELTTVNEMSMTVGLVMLSIGNFLGGQWANESWGRYWGWDPKENMGFN